MKSPAILAAVFLVSGVGALAATPEGEARSEAEASAKKEKKVCKTEKLTGSLTRVRRVCMTRSEWAELAENHNRAIDRMGRSANQAEALTNRTQPGLGGGPAAGGGHTF